MKYWIKEVNGFTSKQKPMEYEMKDGAKVPSSSYEPYPEYTDEEVEALFAAAFEQNAVIKDVDGVPTLVKREEPELTPEQIREKYESEVNERIREKYTLSQELAILRQRDTKPEEYAEYNAYCEQCKAQAKIKYNIGE